MSEIKMVQIIPSCAFLIELIQLKSSTEMLAAKCSMLFHQDLCHSVCPIDLPEIQSTTMSNSSLTLTESFLLSISNLNRVFSFFHLIIWAQAQRKFTQYTDCYW